MPVAAPLATADLQSRQRDPDLRIIDVRTPAEFETAHIPGSYNVPLQNLAEHRGELAAHLDETVVLVCQSGNRAKEAEQHLAQAGMSNVHVLDGGMLAWQRTGGEVVEGRRQRWGLVDELIGDRR
jgi:rhodanese-related sulfurtransferase